MPSAKHLELAGSELFLRIQANDPDAFGALYDRFESRGNRVAYAITGDRARVEDILQEAFLSIWRSRDRYEPARGSVIAWVLGIVRNRAIDSLRRNGGHDAQRASDENIDEHLHAPGDVEEMTTERDDAARLRTLLSQLPAAQRRDVIALAYFGELTTSEIATELSLPLGTIKGRMRLGLEKVRAELLPATGGGPNLEARTRS